MGRKDFDLGALARQLAGDGVSNLNTVVEDVRSIPVEKISANSGNFYEKSDIDELAASIELTGLIHPIVVKEDGQGGYTIIDGERRFTAMKQLQAETVPAIVRRPVNEVVEELMLIEANRTQRKMSPADIAMQAERYTELLAKLKESGVEIPGRLRDRVAEAMQISSAKLARLHAIMENLTEPYLGEFKAGTLNESVAYELSKLAPGRQAMVGGKSAAKLTAYDVKSRDEYAEVCLSGRDCPFGGVCDHGNQLYRKGLSEPSWRRCVGSGYSSMTGCCKTCGERFNCKSVCAKATLGVLAEQLTRAVEKDRGDAAAAEERIARQRYLAKDWGRLRRLRERAGIDIDAAPLATISKFYARLESRVDVPEWLDDRDVADHFDVPDLMQLARLFECSMEDLLGLETPTLPAMWWYPASEPVPEHIAGKVATWGVNGLGAVKAGEFAAYHGNFPELYQWWAEVAGPKEDEGDG